MQHVTRVLRALHVIFVNIKVVHLNSVKFFYNLAQLLCGVLG
jgi:hypothetical protein